MNAGLKSITDRWRMWVGVVTFGAVAVAIVAISIPNLLRVRRANVTRPLIASSDSFGGFSTVMDKTLSLGAEVPDRKIVRTSAFELIVTSPAQSSEKIRVLAEQLGGYLESSHVSGGQDSPSATITIRLPVARLEEARSEIKKLATRVDGEKTDARDLTKEYVDLEARLRNLRAEEEQYLAIMKRANTVKDTLEVSEKLNQARGQIEQQQAEFNALSKQVETVAITVELRAQADAQVFGLRWRPLYQLKLAARDGVEGLADYAATMASVVFYVPTILLWLMTILVGAAVGWRILRWAARVFFAFPKTAAAGQTGR